MKRSLERVSSPRQQNSDQAQCSVMEEEVTKPSVGGKIQTSPGKKLGKNKNFMSKKLEVDKTDGAYGSSASEISETEIKNGESKGATGTTVSETDEANKNKEQKSSEVRRRFYANCDFAYRSSWHGTFHMPDTEQEVSGASASGIAVRSRSHGNLQQKSKLKFFKRRSYPVNPTPPSSPTKTGPFGFKSLFQNLKRSKQQSNQNEASKNRNSMIGASGVEWSLNPESVSDQTTRKRIRTSPEIDTSLSSNTNENRTLLSLSTGSVVQAETANQLSVTQNTNSQSEGPILNCSLPEISDLNSVQTGSKTHPIHTFQLQSRNCGNQSVRTSSSMFGRSRLKKSVIKDVEDNLTHPAILVILSVINFILWMFLVSVKVLRCTAKVSIWIWLRLAYIFDFVVKLFYRIFNLDPEKANQNSDYSHIESKYIFYTFFSPPENID